MLRKKAIWGASLLILGNVSIPKTFTQSCKGTYQASGLPTTQVHIHLPDAADPNLDLHLARISAGLSTWVKKQQDATALGHSCLSPQQDCCLRCLTPNRPGHVRGPMRWKSWEGGTSRSTNHPSVLFLASPEEPAARPWNCIQMLGMLQQHLGPFMHRSKAIVVVLTWPQDNRIYTCIRRAGQLQCWARDASAEAGLRLVKRPGNWGSPLGARSSCRRGCAGVLGADCITSSPILSSRAEAGCGPCSLAGVA